MRSLFVKLFLAFLLAMLLSGVVFLALLFPVKGWLMENRHPIRRESLRTEAGRPLPMAQPHPPFSEYDVHAMKPPVPLRNKRPPHPGPPFLFDLGFHILIFLVVGGGICYLLAWRITAPVRKLRQAVQQLADGNLSARTGIAADHKGDEITDLGRDFDRMAERIESLLLAQKQLVRDISHELRSPLARLQVALGLARRNASSATEKSLDRIERETERLNALIGELLTLSLLENEAGLPECETVDLNTLLAEVAQDASFEAAGSTRQVVVASGPSLIVPGNRELLRRAVENVVRNGLHYTADGTAVTIALAQDEQGDAVISVCDRGPGVPAEMLSAIFQPFYRVAEARDRQSGGAGIGLAITARAISLHGGTVYARNRDGGGLEIELGLPCNREEANV